MFKDHANAPSMHPALIGKYYAAQQMMVISLLVNGRS